MNRQPEVHVYDTLIVGTGFTGIGAAIKLTQAGVDDIVIVERDQRAGGTWRDNTYPGAACDIPSRLYSYSFAPNPDWSHTYSGSAEILGYIDSMVEKFELSRYLRFGHTVVDVTWHESRSLWEISVQDREPVLARTVV